ncbi:MAG: class I SAM-dependent methyltransferase [Planctomycetota bacterium]|jgi:ubiquinone/menaquinone biosynthesis C-methylase UbiE
MRHLPDHTDIVKRQRAERGFFDEKVKWEEGLEKDGIDARKGRAWLELLGIHGELRGRDVLECACGSGNLTVKLAEEAKTIKSFDISPESVRITKERLKKHGLKNVEVEVSAMEALPYDDESFDLVVGLFILHHLADLKQGIKEVSRVLKSGGKAVFYETSACNPVLMFWRRYLAGRWGIPKLGTKDEHPLTRADLQAISSAFHGRTEISHPRFRFFGKLYFQLLRNFRLAKPILEGLDDFMYRCVPFVRQYSYQVMITLMK